MKQELAFITSDDFEDFTSQLIGQELPGFMAIEGSGGDGGLDGLDGTTAYQMYFPEHKNRDAKHYIAKIDQTLAKLGNTIVAQGLEVDRWILVVPQDVHFTVAIYLQKKTKETGINCIYWGASQLTALLAKHPQIRDNFPEIFLPDVKLELGEMKTGITRMSVPRTEHNIEIVTDEDYRLQKEAWRDELRMRFRSARSLVSSGSEEINYGYRNEMDGRLLAIDAKKAASDEAFELDLADIRAHYKQEMKTRQRGVMGHISPADFDELDPIRQHWYREVKRLKMKYGREGVYHLDEDF